MADGIILWPGEHGGDGPLAGAGGWARVAGGRIVQRGSGVDWRGATGLVALPQDDRALVLVPAGDVALHWIAAPGMTVRQGAAAAPLMATEASIGSAEGLHAVTLAAIDPARPHIVAVTARAVMEDWLARAADAGLPDAAIVPAALLLPPVEDGFVAARFGEEAVLRGVDCALGAGDPFAALVVGDGPVRELSAAEADLALVAGLAHPPLDLRTGLYARRAPRAVDPAWLGRVALLTALIALGSLLIALVTIVRLHVEAASLDARTLALAAPAVPQAADAADAEARLSDLVARRGGAGGFTGPAAAVMAAMQGTPSVRLTLLSQANDGSLRLQLAAPRPEDINVVLIAIQNAGWRIAANAVQQRGAETVADIAVQPA